jgi:hypothetical protein
MKRPLYVSNINKAISFTWPKVGPKLGLNYHCLKTCQNTSFYIHTGVGSSGTLNGRGAQGVEEKPMHY